ncbi:MAG: autotransporter-associated beta strand repeat-containing protein [Luteolibacter sp.]
MKTKSTSFIPFASRACVTGAALVITVSLVAISAPSALAADATWNLNNAESWVTDANWNPAAAPGSTASTTNTDTATFGTIISAARIITVDTDRNIFGINFAGNSSAYTLSSGNLLLTSGGTLQTSGGGSTHTDTITAPITLEGDYTFATNSTTVGRILSVGTTVTSAQTAGVTTLSLAGIGTSANNAITGIISNGTGTNKVAISKSGAGLWVLSGANNFTGDVAVSAGTLQGANTANTNVLTALGSGNINLNAGTLQLRANAATNNGATVITGNGTTGNNVTTGSSAATINVDRFSGSNVETIFRFNNLTVGTGTLTVSGANNYAVQIAGTTTLTGNAVFSMSSSSLNLVGAIGDGGGGFGLTKLGAVASYVARQQVGVLTVSGTSTYTGVTSVLEGMLQVNANAPSGASGPLGNATSAVLLGNTTGSVNAYINSGNVTVGRDITIQSGNTGTAFLGSNSGSSGNTYSGTITLGSAGQAGHGATLFTGSNHTQTFSGVIQDSPTLVGTAGVLTFGDVSTANFLTGTFGSNPSNGGSIFILSNANTYSGGTIINTAGGVRISNADAFGTGNLSIVAGTIQGDGITALSGISGQTWDGNFTLNSFNFSPQGAVNLGTSPILLTGNRTVTVVNNVTTVGGVISGAGRSLTLLGGSAAGSGLKLIGANTFDGGLTIAGASTAANALLVTSVDASALGTGQLNLTNTANSKVALSVDTTVGSLTSGLNNGLASFTGGTSALAAGTYALTFTGGGGSGAAGTATVNATGVVTAVSLTNVGKDYTSAPTITLASSTATVTPATFGSSSINLNLGTSRTLTIAGTNASPTTYTGIISGTGGALIKMGSGTQILTGVNTYTGTTTISGGTLNVTGSLGATAVSVNATGTLTGTGSIGGTVSVDSAGHFASAIASSPGSQIPLQISGTLNLAGGNIVDLTASVAPANGVYILATAAGGVTYTAGTVNHTGVSGVVSVSGNNLILTVGGGGGGNYASWANANGIPGEPASGDFDKDGLTNLVEYALGKNPTVSSQPPGTFSGGVLTFTKGSDAITNGDVTFIIEDSINLVSWAPMVTQNAPNASTTISYTLPTGLPKEFARLKVIKTP